MVGGRRLAVVDHLLATSISLALSDEVNGVALDLTHEPLVELLRTNDLGLHLLRAEPTRQGTVLVDRATDWCFDLEKY